MATYEEVVEASRQLSREEQLALIEELHRATMTPEERAIEAEWIAEAERRYEDFKAGRTKPIPAEEVLEELRAKYGVLSRS